MHSHFFSLRCEKIVIFPVFHSKNVTFQKNSPKKNGKKSIIQKILQIKNLWKFLEAMEDPGSLVI
jgi:hypothetical protein